MAIGSPPVAISLLLPLLLLSALLSLHAAPFDAAPFALPLPDGNGLLWEDPRELHRVVVHFASPPPAPEKIRLVTRKKPDVPPEQFVPFQAPSPDGVPPMPSFGDGKLLDPQKIANIIAYVLQLNAAQ